MSRRDPSCCHLGQQWLKHEVIFLAEQFYLDISAPAEQLRELPSRVNPSETATQDHDADRCFD
jgi:hypothetical protein